MLDSRRTPGRGRPAATNRLRYIDLTLGTRVDSETTVDDLVVASANDLPER